MIMHHPIHPKIIFTISKSNKLTRILGRVSSREEEVLGFIVMRLIVIVMRVERALQINLRGKIVYIQRIHQTINLVDRKSCYLKLWKRTKMDTIDFVNSVYQAK